MVFVDVRAAWNAVERLANGGPKDLECARELAAVLSHPDVAKALESIAEWHSIYAGLRCAEAEARLAIGDP